MVAIKFDDLLIAFEFIGSAAPSEHNAYVCPDTGQIYFTSALNPLDEEVPDDLDTSDRYLQIPHKTELDLGKSLALRFVSSELPDCYEQVAEFFRRKGAYARFKDLLDAEGALDRWYQYEANATESALRKWCAENNIQLIEVDEGPAA